MSEISLLQSALLLGLYVALAGSYAFVYTIARIQDAISLHRLSSFYTDCTVLLRSRLSPGRLFISAGRG